MPKLSGLSGGCILAALVLATIIGAPGLYLVIKADQANSLLEEAQTSLERAAAYSLEAAGDSLEVAARQGCQAPGASEALGSAVGSLEAAQRALEGYARIGKDPGASRLASLAGQLAARLESIQASGCGGIDPQSLREAAEKIREAASLGPEAAGSLEEALRLLGG